MVYPKNKAHYEQAERLLPILMEVPSGDLLSYDRIGEVLGRKFGSTATRAVLRIARSMAIEQGKHFLTMRRDGLRAFRPQDYEAAGEKKVRSIHVAARTGYKIIDSISPAEFEALGNTQQLRQSIRQGQLEMLEKQSSAARFEKVVARNHNQPPDGFNMKAVAEEFASLDSRKPKRKI